MSLSFALKLSNVDKLQTLFAAVSEPTSAQYGDFLTLGELNALTAPRNESLLAVREFVRAAFGAAAAAALDETSSVGYVHLKNVTVAEIEAAFECDMRLLQHENGVASAVKTARYLVPATLAKHVDFVAGLTRVPRLSRARSESIKDSLIEAAATKRQNIPWLGITPRLIRTRYNATDAVPKAKGNRQAIAQFLGQYISELDLEEFFVIMYQELIGTVPSRIVGPNGFIPGIESNLVRRVALLSG